MDELSLVGIMIGLLGLTFAVRAEMRARRDRQDAEARQRELVQYSDQIREMVVQINQQLARRGVALEVDERGLPTGIVVPLEPSVAAASTGDPTVSMGPPSPAPPLEDNEDD